MSEVERLKVISSALSWKWPCTCHSGQPPVSFISYNVFNSCQKEDSLNKSSCLHQENCCQQIWLNIIRRAETFEKCGLKLIKTAWKPLSSSLYRSVNAAHTPLYHQRPPEGCGCGWWVNAVLALSCEYTNKHTSTHASTHAGAKTCHLNPQIN